MNQNLWIGSEITAVAWCSNRNSEKTKSILMILVAFPEIEPLMRRGEPPCKKRAEAHELTKYMAEETAHLSKKQEAKPLIFLEKTNMTKTRKSPTGENGASSTTCRTHYTNLAELSNSTESQRQRILKALRHEPITTLQARQQLAICSPASRIMELRAMGYKIASVWRIDTDSTGQEHRVSQYVLLSEKGTGK